MERNWRPSWGPEKPRHLLWLERWRTWIIAAAVATVAGCAGFRVAGGEGTAMTWAYALSGAMVSVAASACLRFDVMRTVGGHQLPAMFLAVSLSVLAAALGGGTAIEPSLPLAVLCVGTSLFSLSMMAIFGKHRRP